MGNPTVLSRVRRILKRVAASERLPQDSRESELDAALQEVRDLPANEVLASLDAAAAGSSALDRPALIVLAELAHLPAAAERLTESYWRRQLPEERSWILQTVLLGRLTNFIPQLSRIILEDPDGTCREAAMGVAGRFGHGDNLPAVLEQARRGHPGVAVALKDYGREECRPCLREIFDATRSELASLAPLPVNRDVNDPLVLRHMQRESGLKAESVVAAWGLAKLGDNEALAYLGEMLYDPVLSGRNYSAWGESLRAAQAIAELHGLPFDHTTKSVPHIRAWWEANRNQLLLG